MRNYLGRVLAAAGVTALLVTPMFAGALTLRVINPAESVDAAARNAAFIVKTTACISPQKTTITASAEALVDGEWKTVRLIPIALSEPGTFAIPRDLPFDGQWAVKVVANNPDYGNYTTGVIVPVNGGAADWAAARDVYHAPTPQDVKAVLKDASAKLAKK